MLSIGSQLALTNPAVLHSLVDGFFEGKKALVKERLMESVKVVVDGLFVKMVGQVKEMLLPSKSAGVNDQIKTYGSNTPAKPTTSVPPSPPLKNKMTFATKSKPGPSSFSVPPSQPFSGLYKLMAEEDGVSISNSNSKPNKKKAITVELQIDGPLDDEDNYSDLDINGGAGAGDTELVINTADGNENAQNASKELEQQQRNSTQAGKFQCTEPGCGKHFTINSNLRRHLRTHNNTQKPFGCTYNGCTSEFGRREHAIRHILNVHLKKQYPGDDEEGNGDNNHPPDPTNYLSVKDESI